MEEILRSNARVARVCDWTLAAVAAVSAMAVTSSALILIWEHAVMLALTAPSAAIVLAVVAAVFVQRRAVRRHEALCDSARMEAVH